MKKQQFFQVDMARLGNYRMDMAGLGSKGISKLIMML